jgi:sortase A
VTAARVLHVVGRVLVSAGVVVLLFVAFQLWGTGLSEARAQAALEDEFARLLTAVPDGPGPAAPPTTLPVASPTPDPVVVAQAADVPAGGVAARLRIPAIGVDKLVVEGVGEADLRRGPGHYPTTPQPGFGGNAGIAGHRTTYGQPFHDLDRLAPGDRIEVTTLLGTFTYEVLAPEDAHGDRLGRVADVLPGAVVVAPSDTWVLADAGDDRLTLTACHPRFSARQRIVVAARLIGPSVDRPIPTDIVEGAPGLAFGEEPESTEPAGAALGGATDAGPSLGLEGETSALTPALLWGAVALAAHLGTLHLARGRRRLPIHVAGAIPVAVALWWCFAAVDRLLPAY